MIFMDNRRLAIAALLSGTILATAPAKAQQAAGEGPENRAASQSEALSEIVVTAQRRSQSLQEVPIAVSSATSEQLNAAGVTNTLEVAQITPGLQLRQTAGNVQPNIRGVGANTIGPGLESPIALYIDGVYIASAVASLLNLANIDRVEVLKGPQGTLFGRNATGGLIQVVTRKPDFSPSGEASLSYGNYDSATGSLYFTGGASDTLAADIAIHYKRQGQGWGKNLNTGNDVYRDDDDLAVRTKLLWKPGSETSVMLSGDYSYKESSKILSLNVLPGREDTAGFNLLYAAVTGSAPQPFGGFYEMNQTYDPRSTTRSQGIALDITHDLGPVQLKSITAKRDTRFYESFDLDYIPQHVVSFDDGVGRWRQFSQEFQAISTNDGPFTWTAGLYYFHSRDSWEPHNVTFGPFGAAVLFGAPGVSLVALTTRSQVKTDSYAGYGQATYELLPTTRLTLGGRYTDEKRSVSGAQALTFDGFPIFGTVVPPAGLGIPARLKFNNFSYRIALDQDITDDILVYASYNTGFKSGGYNIQVPENPPFQPEEIRAFEVGFKSELFDRRIRLNLAAFYYKYRNIQVGSYAGTAQIIYNGARATIKGVDGDIAARLAPGLTLTGGFSYVHDRFTSFPDADYSYSVPDCNFSNPSSSRFCQANAAGNKLANSPTFTGNIGLNWDIEMDSGTLTLSSNFYHNSGWYGTVDNNPRAKHPAYQLLNASIGFQPANSGLRFTIWGRNITDERYSDQYLTAPGGIIHTAAEPLTYGATIKAEF